MTPQDLRGQAALITGGSALIARTLAVALAAQGVRVALCGKRADMLALAADQIQAAGGACLALPAELDSLAAAEAVAAETQAAFGRLDLLIMVSPFWAGGHVHTHSEKTWDLVLSANLREPFLLARAVLPHFRAQGRGEIMAITSDSALGHYARDGAYGVALHGLRALLELIRVENADHGVRTHFLAPGVALTTDTDSEGQPALTPAHVVDWALWLLTRPAHLRGNGPILV